MSNSSQCSPPWAPGDTSQMRAVMSLVAQSGTSQRGSVVIPHCNREGCPQMTQFFLGTRGIASIFGKTGRKSAETYNYGKGTCIDTSSVRQIP